jgi:hypothetical protein
MSRRLCWDAKLLLRGSNLSPNIRLPKRGFWMRMVRAVLLAGAASVWSGSALAADALKFGPAPAWVHQQVLPPAKTTQAPVQLLLDDEQISL